MQKVSSGMAVVGNEYLVWEETVADAAAEVVSVSATVIGRVHLADLRRDGARGVRRRDCGGLAVVLVSRRGRE